MTQALHETAEKLAAKEIKLDPRGFVERETIKRVQSSNGALSQSQDAFHSFIEQPVNATGFAGAIG